MPDPIPAEWYVNRCTSLAREVSELARGMAAVTDALQQCRAELAQARADLHNATTVPNPVPDGTA